MAFHPPSDYTIKSKENSMRSQDFLSLLFHLKSNEKKKMKEWRFSYFSIKIL
jgi:hypothetical protein